MKKYFHDQQYILFNRKRAEESETRRRASKTKRKLLNSNLIGVSKKNKFEHYRTYTKIVAPENFFLINNPHPQELIDFINTLKDCFERRERVFVILRNIKKIDYDAILLLLSAMIRFKAFGVRFNGDFPNDLQSRNILIKSNFFYNLYQKEFEDVDKYYLSTDSRQFITHANKEVDSNQTDKVIEDMSTTIWYTPRRCQGVQTTLTELMQNTLNHASPIKEGEKHWWLAVKKSQAERKVKFSFLDYGVGVFESLRDKTEDSPWYQAIPKMFRKFNYSNNAKLLELIMTGELHKTVTGEYFRGQGLPGMVDSMNENWFSNLHIITNDVYANVSKNEYKTMNRNFRGTFIYFEVSYINRSFDRI